mmetsp:Transcript_40476/g.96205  ORF Transcript_40476/g.96205 Transcript_40476/m.96205 type:complete len:219 (-) Transcript_40476:257-913(-)
MGTGAHAREHCPRTCGHQCESTGRPSQTLQGGPRLAQGAWPPRRALLREAHRGCRSESPAPRGSTQTGRCSPGGPPGREEPGEEAPGLARRARTGGKRQLSPDSPRSGHGTQPLEERSRRRALQTRRLQALSRRKLLCCQHLGLPFLPELQRRKLGQHQAPFQYTQATKELPQRKFCLCPLEKEAAQKCDGCALGRFQVPLVLCRERQLDHIHMHSPG